MFKVEKFVFPELEGMEFVRIYSGEKEEIRILSRVLGEEELPLVQAAIQKIKSGEAKPLALNGLAA